MVERSAPLMAMPPRNQWCFVPLAVPVPAAVPRQHVPVLKEQDLRQLLRNFNRVRFGVRTPGALWGEDPRLGVREPMLA